MNSRYKLKNPSSKIRLGLVFLILFNLSNYFLTSRQLLSGGVRDGFTGILFGVSAGCLLLGLRLKSRGPGPDGGRCA